MKDHLDLRVDPEKLMEVGYAFYHFYEIHREELNNDFGRYLSEGNDDYSYAVFCFAAFSQSYSEYYPKLN